MIRRIKKIVRLKRPECGFSLLEALVALAIISGALVTIIYTVNYHLSLISRHETITVATILGREKLFNITSLNQVDKKGSFEPLFKDYAYDIEIIDSPLSEIKLVKLNIIKDEEHIQLLKLIKP